MKLIQLRGIMTDMGRIHRELGNFVMFSSKLIKSYNESMIGIGGNNVL